MYPLRFPYTTPHGQRVLPIAPDAWRYAEDGPVQVPKWVAHALYLLNGTDPGPCPRADVDEARTEESAWVTVDDLRFLPHDYATSAYSSRAEEQRADRAEARARNRSGR